MNLGANCRSHYYTCKKWSKLRPPWCEGREGRRDKAKGRILTDCFKLVWKRRKKSEGVTLQEDVNSRESAITLGKIHFSVVT